MLRFEVVRSSIMNTADKDSELQPCEEAFEDNGRWFVFIEDLEALKAFVLKYDQIVMYPCVDDQLFMEIYDDYRE